MKLYHIFFNFNGKDKTFRHMSMTKKEAIEELQYLYGRNVNILGVRSKDLS